MRKALALVTLILLLSASALSHENNSLPTDVTIGRPKVWKYSRIYPLLDGLFEDVASIRLSSLTLNPNAPNASTLNALQQSFDLQVKYDQLNGIQNSSASQQLSAVSAAATLQTQLIKNESQLIQAQQQAQAEVGKAQSALDGLPSTAPADQRSAAQLTLNQAQDNLTSITQQLTDVNNQLASSNTTPEFKSNIPSSKPPQSSLPSSLTAPGGKSFSPNLPPTKELDNQVGLLWARLARLLGVMTRPDSLRKDNLYLVEFDTGIAPSPSRRKKKLLVTRYSLGCRNPSEPPPIVVDEYPRTSAINITDEQYRKSHLGLRALLGFFAWGIDAGFNRDHLQISEMLSQSAYTTGFGVGESRFGWLFGISLGDDSVSPGERRTFAVIAVPHACASPSVRLSEAVWTKKPAIDGPAPLAADPPESLPPWPLANFPEQDCHSCIASLSYGPVGYDPTKLSTKSPLTVMLAITLKNGASLDPEETVSVNGDILRRARDTFGRATPGTASLGIFETKSLGVNTWIPVSSHTLVLNLNATMFGSYFPRILLMSPSGLINVNDSLRPSTLIYVSGQQFTCGADCSLLLPPLGRPKGTLRRITGARWKSATSSHVKIALTDTDPKDAQPLSSATSPLETPKVQGISDSASAVWGPDPEVMAIQGQRAFPLGCEPQGQRLVCELPSAFNVVSEMQIQVYDQVHKNGPMKGSFTFRRCSGVSCFHPFVWSLKAPQWHDGKWRFSLLLANAKKGEHAILGDTSELTAPIECSAGSRLCNVTFSIPESSFRYVHNSMTFTIIDAQKKVVGPPSTILNLLSQIRPVVTGVYSGQTHFTGENLVFHQLQVGNGKPIALTCVNTADDCRIKGYGPKAKGYLYFVVPNGTPIPVLEYTSKGSSTIYHSASKAKTLLYAGPFGLPAPRSALPTSHISQATAATKIKKPHLYVVQ